MDVKQAIEAIKANYPHENYTELKEALDLAIQALEKQVPKKVLRETIEGEILGNFEVISCPACHCEVDYNYCQECGQKLDWGVVNE